MKTKEYKLGQEARQAIIRVAEQMGNIVGKTLGPAGRNYLIPTGVTNDGRTIISHARFADECEDSISLAFNEIAQRTDKEAGDGTTTSVVIGTKLTQTVLDKVMDIDVPTPGSVPVMHLARQLEEEKEQVLAEIEKRKKPVESLEQLINVATTSMEDERAAKIVAEAIWEAGKDTMPVLDEGFTGKIAKDVTPGVKFPLKVAAEFMFNKPNEAVLENIPVLVVNHHFEQYAELSNFMMSLMKEKNVPGLVIVAKNFSVPFISYVAEIKNKTRFPIVLLSEQKLHSDTFKDIAAYLDAKYIDTHPKMGKKITEVSFADTGLAKKVIVRSKEAIFIQGRGLEALLYGQDKTQTRVGARIDEIAEQLKTERTPTEREQMERRMAALQGGIATIFVDAPTAAEKYYLKLKVEDTLNSCRNALREGMVVGGGQTLKEIAEQLGEEALLYSALVEPYNRIQRNHGTDLAVPDNVFDSVTSTKAAVSNAVSVVKILLTTEGVISDVSPSLVEELKSKLFETS